MSFVRSLMLAALLVALSVLLPSQVSAQGGAQILYRWVLNFDFAQSDDGLLTVTVRYLYPNGTYVDFVSTPSVPCKPKGAGTVTVANGRATFASGGYLECALPSIRNEIRALYPPANPDDYQDPFWVRAVSAVDTSISTPLSGNPVIAHPDIALFLPYNSAGGTAQARILTRDHDTISPPYSPATPSTVIVNQRNWLEENGTPGCTVRVRHQGNDLPLDPYGCPLPNEAMNFELDATTFYLGYSPADGTYFNGSLFYLVVDPVVWGVLD
jgi:hypothetical protein